MSTRIDPVLLSDPSVTSLEVVEDGSPLVDLGAFGVATVPVPPPLPPGIRVPYAAGLTPAATDLVRSRPFRPRSHAQVRRTLAERLATADANLPSGIRLLVVEGLRPLTTQQAIHDGYRRRVAAERPWAADDEIDALTSRFVSPPAVAPHVSGAAVDLTLTGPDGPLDLGTPIDATPEESEGACYLHAPNLSGQARHHRALLVAALEGVGLINYPTEWWHWSFGDRYWAMATGAPFAIHGPAA